MRKVFGAFLFFTLSVYSLFSESGRLPLPVLYGKAAVLMDYTTGKILYEKKADLSIPPASLTKLVTLDVVLNRVEEGKLSLDQIVPIPEDAWASNMPRGSSLMFLGPNMKVTLEELIKGLSVSSGNDAAYAIADYIAGGEDPFARMMNDDVQAMGLLHLYFVEPSGLSEENTITAREFALFCMNYIHSHPEAISMFHSLKEFTFPSGGNMVNGHTANSITQQNRNRLLWDLPYVDGLKTGYIDESGYNIALTGEKDGMRLIAVILGIEGKNHLDGEKKREEDGKKLLDYGFTNFVLLHPRDIHFPAVRVWKGKSNYLELKPSRDVVVVVPKKMEPTLETQIRIPPFIEAPVEAGQVLGEIIVTSDETVVERFNLKASESVERGGVFKVASDIIRLLTKKTWISVKGLFQTAGD